MITWVVALLLCLAMAAPVHAGSTFGVSGVEEWRFATGTIAPGYIVSGCAPAVPGSGITLSAFSCTAWVTVADGHQEAIIQGAIAFTLPPAGDGTYWLMAYKDTSSAVAGWLRSDSGSSKGSHYMIQVSATRPAAVPGGLFLSRITVAGGNITVVLPLAPKGPLAAKTGMVVVNEYATSGDGSPDNPWGGWYSQMPLGTNRTYYFPSGVYSNSAMTNFPYENVTISADGVLLKHTGSGAAFGCDVGAGGAAVYNFVTIGKIMIQGNASTTDGVLLRGCHHISLDKIRVHDVAAVGLRTQWVVELYARQFTVSSNEKRPYTTTSSGYAVQPVKGIQLDVRGVGEYTSNVVFDTPTIEGVSGVGIDVVEARDCLFSSGTSEGNDIGFRTEANAARITVNTMDFESNASNDATFSGVDNAVFNSNFQSASSGNTVEVVTGQRTKFHGGYLRTVNLQSTSADTLFFGATVADHVSLGIKGTGTYKAIGVKKVNGSYITTASPADHLADISSFTPTIVGASTPGTFTYATRSGVCGRVAQYVHCVINLVLSGISVAPVGAITITGLPYTSDSTFLLQPIVVSQWGVITMPSADYKSVGGYINAGSTVITLTHSGDNVAALGMVGSAIASTSSLYILASYIATQN